MNNNKNIYSVPFKYLGGLLFLVPFTQPFLLCLVLYININDGTKVFINKKAILKLIYLSLIFLPIIALINILSALLLNDHVPQAIVQSINSSERLLFFNYFSIIIISPIIEELYFRKVLFKELHHRLGPVWGILLSSMYFSFVHLNILSLPTLFALGIFLGTIFKITKSILFCIIVHSLFNLFMLYSIIF